MLRMGKSHKTEQAEQERNNTQYQAQYNAQPGYPAYQTPEAQPQPATPLPNTVTRAVSESEALARDIKEGTLTGYVGNGTSLTGEASFRGMLRVDGHLTGRVMSQDGTLLVGTNGRLDADIEVAVATINGTVNGDITATERLEMGRAAHVKGNIQTPSLMIEQGAIFEGSCRMLQLKESQENERPNDNGTIKKDYEEEAATAQVENVSDVAS
ncbi:MAG: polymer-forming cytoskeletal protein [Acidobacteria bacterium]|nr:polymer-forming cytoskeletal protein [Acidobacteriota bacterium]